MFAMRCLVNNWRFGSQTNSFVSHKLFAVPRMRWAFFPFFIILSFSLLIYDYVLNVNTFIPVSYLYYVNGISCNDDFKRIPRYNDTVMVPDNIDKKYDNY